MNADKLTSLSSLSDIEERIADKIVEIEQSEEVSDSEFNEWIDNIKHEVDGIDSNMFKLKVNIDPELLAEGLDELLNLLKPQIPKENNTEDNTKLADKMSKELNDHYHCQAILHIYS